MSGTATFSQPATATTGLQNYNLEGKVKRLYPSPLLGKRLGLVALLRNRAKRGFRQTGLLKKGLAMAHEVGTDEADVLEKMVGTLRSSVDSIVAAGGNIDEALTKSFGEFQDVLRGKIEEELAAQPAVAEGAIVLEPLFKGLGCVGRLASLAKMASDQVELIKAGQDYRGSDRSNDPANEDVAMMLDSGVHCFELALRSAVNDHVQPLDDDDDMSQPPPGLIFVHVPDPADPDNEDAGDVVKCDLPLELTKYVTFPEVIEHQKLELGGGLMLLGGVPEETLSKLFEGDLAKFTDSQGAGGASGGDPTIDPNADPNADPNPDDGSQDDPLDVLGRILAAGMIQLDHIRALIEGTATAGDPVGDPNADPGADPNAAPPADAPGADPAPAGGGGNTPPKKKTPPFLKKFESGGLQKVDGLIDDPRYQELSTKVSQLEGVLPLLTQIGERLEKLAGTPQTQMPALMDLDPPRQQPEGLGAPTLETLAKLSEDERATLAVKAIHRGGVAYAQR